MKNEQNIRVAVIGVGNMGSKYAKLLQDQEIAGMQLVAMTRIGASYQELLQPSVEAGVPVYPSSDVLFDAVEKGELVLDAVIIATPHYAHEAQATRAFSNGLFVLSDKPAGVYSAQARRMNEAADAKDAVYGMVFNQRTLPIHKRIKEIVESGRYGALKRVNWVVTDWYRPEQYYSASSWHATWEKDGGGVLLNQCPHNLDLLCWICGMPSKVLAVCKEGHFHNIEVEDDVTMYMEWENGATGTFISSTGDAPGVNRLEISLEEAMIVCEKGKLRIGEIHTELGMPEAEYRATSQEFFRKINGSWTEEEPEAETAPYRIVLQNFADACAAKKYENRQLGLVADGREGYQSLVLSNAAYLSSWEERMIRIPKAGTDEERAFEEAFEAHLNQKIKGES